MKKRIIQGFVQYISALLLVACAFLTVYAYDAGKLPASGGKNTAEQKESTTNDKEAEKHTSAAEPARQTADTFAASLEKADGSAEPYPGVYGEGCGIVLRPLSGVRLDEGEKLVRMGCLVMRDKNGEIKAVYDSSLRDVTDAIEGCTLTYFRDSGGRPLFRRTADGAYLRLSGGKAVESSYDPVALDRGIAAEYPSYKAFCGGDCETFGGDGLYGLRRRGGDVVIPAAYADVFGVCEGYCVAVDGGNRLHLFKVGGDASEIVEVKQSGAFFVPDKRERNETAVGYFFVDKGLTRARTADGREALLCTGGGEFMVPSGFSVAAYSDGAVLLKGQNGYGYMLYDGSWISKPEYSDAKPFREGLAAVRGGNGLWGMIDLRGNTVIPMLFDSIESSSDGVILAYSTKYGYKLFNKTAP